MARELIALALLVACSRDRPADRAPPAPTGPPPLAAASFFRIDAGPRTPCTAGATCEARLVLTALGDYKVNPDYPFKFVVEPSAAVAIDGTGTFALDDARNGTLTIKFKPRAPGTATLAGTFKLSVCTAEVCEIESPRVELAVPVS